MKKEEFVLVMSKLEELARTCRVTKENGVNLSAYFLELPKNYSKDFETRAKQVVDYINNLPENNRSLKKIDKELINEGYTILTRREMEIVYVPVEENEE